MLRCLLVFILFFGFHQFIMGQNCRTITNGSLVFTDKWNESINFVNSSVAPFSISYEGNTNTSLSIGNDFKFSQAQVINIPANGSTPASTQNIAAQGYFINATCSLPAVEGNIKVIHTLKRNFVKGFYTLDFFTSGANIQAFCLYGSGTVAAIPFTTALNTYTSTTSVSGLTNSFSINNSQNSAKRIVYLEGEMNFFCVWNRKNDRFYNTSRFK